MPTNHDETLAERYMRELQTELAIYSRMTPEQISDMATELHNALAARDAALAELAALKGGREAVATVTISHFRQDPTMENVDFQLDAKLPCGTHKLYLSQPAQASAWVPVSGRLPAWGYCIAYRPSAPTDNKVATIQYSPHAGGFSGQYPVTHWQPLPAPPTPGASDGKGCKP